MALQGAFSHDSSILHLQTLKEEHFQTAHLPHSEAPLPEQTLFEINPVDGDNDESPTSKDEELGIWKRHKRKTVNDTFSDDTSVSSGADDVAPALDNFDMDEETILIAIPLPGLVLIKPESDINASLSATARTGTVRLVPGFCTICLSGFVAGSDIVWSSNKKCEHCFHCECMEQWLTKQRHGATDGPICPCCRRDFIVDPYDLMLSLQAENESDGPDEAKDNQESVEVRNDESTSEPSSLHLNWGDGEVISGDAVNGDANADGERSPHDRNEHPV